MPRRLVQFGFLALLCLARHCLAQSPEILTSFSILDDWTQRLVGSAIPHRALIPADSELHGYQLTVPDAHALSQAKLIVGLNPAVEPWLADWVRANHKEGRTLWLAGAQPFEAAEDPHVWTDPSRVVLLVERLGAGLGKVFPGVRTQVAQGQYIKDITALDLELRAAFATVPPERRAVVTQHPNLGRFAERYHLKVFGTILESPAAEAADPSVRRYADLLKLIRDQRVRTVVADEGQNDAIARRLCQDAGIPAPVAVSFETLAPAGRPGDNWLEMMRLNGRKLREALLRP